MHPFFLLFLIALAHAHAPARPSTPDCKLLQQVLGHVAQIVFLLLCHALIWNVQDSAAPLEPEHSNQEDHKAALLGQIKEKKRMQVQSHSLERIADKQRSCQQPIQCQASQ